MQNLKPFLLQNIIISENNLMSTSDINSLNNNTLEINKDRFLTCPIHLETLEDPVQGPCGHVFCRKCILNWLRKNDLCPICQRKIDKSQLYSALIVKQILDENNHKTTFKKERRDLFKPLKEFITYYTDRSRTNRWDLKIIIVFLSMVLLLMTNYYYEEKKLGLDRLCLLICSTIIVLIILKYIRTH